MLYFSDESTRSIQSIDRNGHQATLASSLAGVARLFTALSKNKKEPMNMNQLHSMKNSFLSCLLLLGLSVSAHAQSGQRGQTTSSSSQVEDIVKFDQGGRPTYSKRISWRAKDLKQHFTVELGRRSNAVKVMVNVWVLGDTNIAPHAPSKPAVKNAKMGRLVYSQDLGLVKDKANFTIDFGDFAPLGNPLIMLFTPADPNESINARLARGLVEQIKKDSRVWIGRNGEITYFVQVQTSDNGASRLATVQYGELALDSTLSPKLEDLVNPGTSEFPDQVWGVSDAISPVKKSLKLRWAPPKGTTSATVQVIKGETSEAWAFWKFADPIITQSIKVSGNGLQQFTVDLSSLVDSDDQTKYMVRVIPEIDSTLLASQPSNWVNITVDNVKAVTKASLKFKTELVGWSQGHEPSSDDQYRFVVANAAYAQKDQLKKIAGGPVDYGTKIYLPPAPPEQETAWYEKVVVAIKWVFDFINIQWENFSVMKNTMISLVKDVPVSLAKKIGVPASIADNSWKTLDSVLNLKGAPMNAIRKIESSPDYVFGKMMDDCGVTNNAERSALRGDFFTALSIWSRGAIANSTTTTMLGLSPDPDYEVRPGIAFVNVTATANGKLPDNYRASGPTLIVEVGSIAQNTELLGLKPEYYPLYQGTTVTPTLAAGQSIIVPVVLKYHWSKDQRPKDWNFGYVYSTKAQFSVNTKITFHDNLHDTWGEFGNQKK